MSKVAQFAAENGLRPLRVTSSTKAHYDVFNDDNNEIVSRHKSYDAAERDADKRNDKAGRERFSVMGFGVENPKRKFKHNGLIKVTNSQQSKGSGIRLRSLF